MSKHLDRLALERDFPGYGERIRQLMETNELFKRRLSQYEEVTDAISRVQDGVDLLPDLKVHGLKIRRAHLKGELSRLLAEQADLCHERGTRGANQNGAHSGAN